MALDFTTENQLESIAGQLETKAGIPTPAQQKDTAIESKLRRISDALTDFVGSIETHTLPEHTDVDDSTVPALAEYLRGNGTDWVNSPILMADIPQVLLADGSRPLTAPWDSQDKITATAFCVDSTIDHSFTNESGALVFTNFNSDQDVVMRINDGGTIHDFWTLDASIPSIVFEPTGGTGQIVNEGILVVKGAYRGPAAWGVMDFSPTSVQGTSYGFFIRPLYSGSIIGEGVHCQPTVAVGQNLNYSAYVMQMPTVTTGFNSTYTLVKDVSPRVFTTDSGTKIFNGMIYGSGIVSQTGDTSTVIDTALELTGGFFNLASAVITRYGLRLKSFGSAFGSGIQYGIHADGGVWLMASDSGTIQLGAGTDSEIGYDGVNLFIDPDLEGAGRVLIGATGDDDITFNSFIAEANCHLDAVNAKMMWGEAQECSIFYDGTNMIIEPDENTSGADLVINEKTFISPSAGDSLEVNNRIFVNTDAAGIDFGAAPSGARIAYNGTDLQIFPKITGAGVCRVIGDLEIDEALDHDGTTIGFFGTVPVPQSSAYTVTNVTTDRTYNAASTTVDILADVLGTLIADLQAYGLLQ